MIKFIKTNYKKCKIIENLKHNHKLTAKPFKSTLSIKYNHIT